jgi:MFS family permease
MAVVSDPVAAAPVPRRRLPRPLRPFRHRDYRLLVASMAASLFASGMWTVALVYQVIALGGGPSELSLVMAALSAGLLASVLIGGVAADRLPRRALLIGVEVVRICSVGLVAALSLSGALQLWQLCAVAFVVGAAEAFFFPPTPRCCPRCCPPTSCSAANGVEGMAAPDRAAGAGPGAGRPARRRALPGAALAVATAGVRRRAAAAARHAGHARGPGGRGRQLGARATCARALATSCAPGGSSSRSVFATLLVLVVIGPIEVLVPFAVRDQTGAGPEGYAFVLAGYGSGGVVGSLLASATRLPRRYLTVMILLWGRARPRWWSWGSPTGCG